MAEPAKPPDPTPPHGLLDGKCVLLTAAAGTGIGFATARRCLEEGARVCISDLHERRLHESADRLAEVGGEPPHALLCDVTNEGQVRALVGSSRAMTTPSNGRRSS